MAVAVGCGCGVQSGISNSISSNTSPVVKAGSLSLALHKPVFLRKKIMCKFHQGSLRVSRRHLIVSTSAAAPNWKQKLGAENEDQERTCQATLQGQDHVAVEELILHTRRSFVILGATLATLALSEPLLAFAEPVESASKSNQTESTTVSNEASGAEPADSTPASKPKKPVVDTSSWYRFRGEGFRMKIPPDFEDIVEYDDSGASLYGERAKEKPFAARFASSDRKEVLSVVVRSANQLKLSFFETQDISEFGSLEEASKMLVPAGSKVVAARTFKPVDQRVPRTYYFYEFLTKDKRVAMSAAAAGGRVFVFGAMAPNSRWKEVGNTMRSAAINFVLL